MSRERDEMVNVTLFPEHDDYQVGQSHLQKDAVYKFGIRASIISSVLVIVGIILFVTTGNQKRLLDQFYSEGATTEASVVTCRETFTTQRSGRSYTSHISFRYTVDGQNYNNSIDVSGRQCSRYTTNSRFELTYLRTRPTQYGLPSGLPGSDWLPTFVLGIVCFIVGFILMLINRFELRKYTQLKAANIILDARVYEIGEWVSNSRGGRHVHQYAKYRFDSPSGKRIQNYIQTDQRYPFPEHIQEGDILNILYVDDKTYCIL